MNTDLKSETTNNIATHLLRDCQGSLEGVEETILVTVRIAVDLYEFLERHEQFGGADVEDIDYVVNTIRSGMDCFFSCEQHYRVTTGAAIRPKWALRSEFGALRKEYFEVFKRLKSETGSFDDRFNALLVLVELQLQFMAANFHRSRTGAG